MFDNLPEEDKKVADALFQLTLNSFEFSKSDNPILKKLGKDLEVLLNEYNEQSNKIKEIIDYINIDDDIFNCCDMVDVNGIEILKILRK